MSGTKWLVAGTAAYRVVRSDATWVYAVVEAGTGDHRVLGREVRFTRSEIRANVAAGVIRITDVKPKAIPRTGLLAGAGARKGGRR